VLTATPAVSDIDPGPASPASQASSASQAWHSLSAAEVMSQLGATRQGLTDVQATERLGRYGANVLPPAGGMSIAQIVWSQINNALIWVLIASAAIAVAVDPNDGIKNGAVILAVVILNSIIGVIQEFKANQAIAALSGMVPEFAQVERNGTRTQLAVADLVPGDIVYLQSGDKVPADLRLLEIRSLQIEEAALTGESVPVEKHVDAVAIDASLGDRTCMAFSGALVTYGTATGVVATTGPSTELGRINALLDSAESTETPLQHALDRIGKMLTVGIAILAVLIILIGTARAMAEGDSLRQGIRESVIFAITLAVGAIPEGLPAIVTIALAIGVQRMAKRKAVVRKLPSVETLGSTTVICSDKTGTLTRNEMTVQALWTPAIGTRRVTGVGYAPHGALRDGDHGSDEHMTPELTALVTASALVNDSALAQVDGSWHITGDPTEGALTVAAEKLVGSVNDLRASNPRLDTIPFESDRQYMATLHRTNDGAVAYLKGAPEVIVAKCAGVDESAVQAMVEDFASQGMRVLAVAERTLDQDTVSLFENDVETHCRFLGLVGMIDPPRTEVIESIESCHTAGITVKMITGDHATTAAAIGRELGIFGDGMKPVTGKQLAETSDDELAVLVEQTNVFARVTPEQKLRLVKTLQSNGHVAAMTGDGVNDAPALKQADIGVAMGITGTSVSKEAADIVLSDDNFRSIAAAVEEGRRVYDNLIKSLAFVLPTNLGLALILLCAVAFFPFDGDSLLLPMLPTQVLWINLVGAVTLALPLAFEAAEKDVMRRAPREKDAPIMSRFVITRTVLAAVLMTASSVGLFLWEYSRTDKVAESQTMAVTAVVVFQILYLFQSRSLRGSARSVGWSANPVVFAGVGVLVILQALFIWAPPLQAVFGSASLDATATAWSIAVPAVAALLITAQKAVSARRAI
jgi:potassium/sodium efflux P-type ATPase